MTVHDGDRATCEQCHRPAVYFENHGWAHCDTPNHMGGALVTRPESLTTTRRPA